MILNYKIKSGKRPCGPFSLFTRELDSPVASPKALVVQCIEVGVIAVILAAHLLLVIRIAVVEPVVDGVDSEPGIFVEPVATAPVIVIRQPVPAEENNDPLAMRCVPVAATISGGAEIPPVETTASIKITAAVEAETIETIRAEPLPVVPLLIVTTLVIIATAAAPGPSADDFPKCFILHDNPPITLSEGSIATSQFV